MIFGNCTSGVVERFENILNQYADCNHVADRKAEWGWHGEATVRPRKRTEVRLKMNGDVGVG